MPKQARRVDSSPRGMITNRSIPSFLRPPLTASRELLRARFGDRLTAMLLFGSHARGDAHEESDVDVLVLVEGLTYSEWSDTIADFVDTTITYQVDLAPLVMSSERWSSLRAQERALVTELDRDGVAL